MLQAETLQVRFPMRSLDFFNLPNPSSLQYGPGVDTASNRNECQESSWGVKCGRHVRLTTLPPSGSRLSRENLGASMSHNPSQPVTGISFFFYIGLLVVILT
jgi:hypothetical protein